MTSEEYNQIGQIGEKGCCMNFPNSTTLHQDTPDFVKQRVENTSRMLKNHRLYVKLEDPAPIKGKG
ncbi:unnamed protein product [Onchocerca flexuosa]|uniref:Aminopeptidase n=1 Tax=Onchocerca flexuosa TaxID=387005 RepID=A0A183HVH8_9BILA|nr:unnamed protein product [Onchocerca flexuosa]